MWITSYENFAALLSSLPSIQKSARGSAVPRSSLMVAPPSLCLNAKKVSAAISLLSSSFARTITADLAEMLESTLWR